MSTLSSVMNAHVVQAYKAKHSFSCPPFPLEQCGFSRAETDQDTIFIFANPQLQPGENVAMDQLQALHITNAVPNLGVLYYFDRAAAPQQPVADAVAPKDRGYVPDVPKSINDMWQITRDMCR